ncbi:MBL fold metallo-hydrolase [candidate division KSB1 bacterium]
MKINILASGSRGNVTIVKSNKLTILIDAGLSYRDLLDRLGKAGVSPGEIDYIFITHEHHDHIVGLGKFVKYHEKPVFITPGSYVKLKGTIKREIEGRVSFLQPGGKVTFNGLGIQSFPVSHDSAESVGFTFSDNGKKIGYVTDIGYISESVIEELKDVDLLVIESNHDPEMLKNGKYHFVLKKRIAGPEGHISNETASVLISKIFSKRLKAVFLAHISRENNKPDLALSTVKNVLKTIPGFSESNPDILVTFQDKHTDWYEI